MFSSPFAIVHFLILFAPTPKSVLVGFNGVRLVWHLHLVVCCIARKASFLDWSGLINLVKDGKISRARARAASISYLPTIYIQAYILISYFHLRSRVGISSYILHYIIAVWSLH